MTPKAHKYDWVSITDPDSEYEQPAVGLSGTVIGPETSTSDNPFLHPFLPDYEFYVAPDPRYFELVAPRMRDDYKDATTIANTKFGLNVPGVIGMEWDGLLVPPKFMAKEGDRVALFGRWIVDSGHDDFHTEIHPPLLMALARSSRSTQQEGTRAGQDDATTVRIIGRPYLVSQEFGDGGLFEHLIKEVAKVMSPIVPLSTQVEAHPHLLDMPFKGFHILTFKVRPPTAREDFRDSLMVKFSFTRHDKGIFVQLLKGNDNESLRVVIVFNDVGYVPPPQPKGTKYTVSLDDLDAMDHDVGKICRTVVFASVLADPLRAFILNRGIKSTKFPAPQPPILGPATMRALDDVRPADVDQHLDASQPYPKLGEIKLEWERFRLTGNPGKVKKTG